MTRREVTGLIRHPRILQKFYVYDPNVSDLLGGLRVIDERDDKGNAKEGTRHVLAVQQQVQWWIDQGLLGEKPVGQIGDKGKKLLAQITRGRSEDNDAEPARVARLDRRAQSGHPSLAAAPPRKKKKDKKDKKGVAAKPAKTTPQPLQPPRQS
jgi:hypothetical protein